MQDIYFTPHYVELKSLSEGDPSALKYFYAQYAGKITAFAQKLLSSREEAEDIAHNIFLDLWDDRRNAVRINSVDAYLFKMARNAVMNRLRARNRDLTYRKCQGLSEETPFDSDALEEAELDSRLMKAIEALPDKQRQVMMGRVQGLSHEKISEELNVSKHTIHYHITCAMRNLRRALGVFFL
ncbi:MAG: sigma-70 family RNA polymerase sigma factor [Lachnospiraceae bacterium]|nr:sigma-70 family RNA polymerase sigma factor [Lachnospiraceae bacterium]